MIIVATWKVFLVSCGIVGTIIYSHLSEIPCPKKYMDMGGDVIIYCEVTSAGLGHTWSLKKEYYEESDMEGEQ